MPEDMVGTAEIATMLGVTVGRVWQLRQHPDFPPPAYRLRGGDVWHTMTIVDWAAKKGRALHECRMTELDTSEEEVAMPWPLANILDRADVARWFAAHDEGVRAAERERLAAEEDEDEAAADEGWRR